MARGRQPEIDRLSPLLDGGRANGRLEAMHRHFAAQCLLVANVELAVPIAAQQSPGTQQC